MTQLQNIPAFKFSLLLIAGILIGSQFIFDINILIVSFIIIDVIIIFISNKKETECLIFILTGLLITIFGIYKSNIDFFYAEINSPSYFPDTKKKSTIGLTGIISDLPDYDSSRIKLLVECNYVLYGSDTVSLDGNIIADIRKGMFKKNNPVVPVLKAGDKISMRGSFGEAGSVRNPGEFDYKKYLELHNIYKIFSVSGYENVKIISEDNSDFIFRCIIYPAKTFALNCIDKTTKGDEAAFLKGLVAGERSSITEEMKEDFINAGVMHLIAVSGLNVAYIIISITLVLSLFRIPLIPRTFITILFLIFYCLLTGSSASIVRASIMGIIVLISYLIERKINFYNVIGISAMAILIMDSKQLFDAGFILSFSAVLSMAIFLNRFEIIFMDKIRQWNIKGKKIALWISALLFTSLAAQIGTIPVTAMYFGKISIISLPANIIAVPLANFSLAIGFFQIITATFSGYLSSVISEANNFLLAIQIKFIAWCADFDFAFFYVKNFSPADLFCYYLLLIILLSVKNKSRLFFKTVLCVLVLIINFLFSFDFTKKMKITFLDVGQGDCALIQTPDDKTILVDCGRITFTFNSGERTIAPYLRRNGIDKIDLLIVTHFHLDHIGGINYLLKNFNVGKIIESGQNVNSPLINIMDSITSAKNIPREVIRSGDMISGIENIRIYFLFPTDEFVNEAGYTLNNNLNNGSVTFILKYRNSKIFFGGDIEKDGERFLYDNYGSFLKTDILKAAHHGSITSTTIPFIVKNNPQYAIISCGLYNKFKHPSDIVLNRLEKAGAKIFRTDLDGASLFESDGNSINTIYWK